MKFFHAFTLIIWSSTVISSRASTTSTAPTRSRTNSLRAYRPSSRSSTNNGFPPIKQLTDTQLEKSCDDNGVITPLILRPWIYLYRFIPKIYIPSTNLDVSFTLLSTIVLTCIDYTFAQVLYTLGWPKTKHTRAACGSLTTILHSTILLPGLGMCLVTQPFIPSQNMKFAPLWWQDAATALIQFCTGYMIYDAIIQFIVYNWIPELKRPDLSKSDWLFLAHHAVTAFYMTSTRIIEAGHISALMLMFLGEFTSPFQNSFRLSMIAARLDFCDTALFRFLGEIAKYAFAFLYIFFRVVIGPICVAYITNDLICTKRGRSNVPLHLSLLWTCMGWGVIIGSIPWVKDAFRILVSGLKT